MDMVRAGRRDCGEPTEAQAGILSDNLFSAGRTTLRAA